MAVGVGVGSVVGISVAVSVGEGVTVGVSVAVAVGSGGNVGGVVSVAVAVSVGGVLVGLIVAVGMTTSVGAGVSVGFVVGLVVGVSASVASGVPVGLVVAVGSWAWAGPPHEGASKARENTSLRTRIKRPGRFHFRSRRIANPPPGCWIANPAGAVGLQRPAKHKRPRRQTPPVRRTTALDCLATLYLSDSWEGEAGCS